MLGPILAVGFYGGWALFGLARLVRRITEPAGGDDDEQGTTKTRPLPTSADNDA